LDDVPIFEVVNSTSRFSRKEFFVKYALYFFGGSIIIFCATLYWVVTTMIGAIVDAKDLVMKAPIVLEATEKTVQQVQTTIDEARVAAAELKASIPSVEQLKAMTPGQEQLDSLGATAGKIGADALKGFTERFKTETKEEAVPSETGVVDATR
jgi:hypothetical protein